MKTIKISLVIALSLLTFCLFSQTINVPVDYSTIQEAIDEAADGSTIIIANGTYDENISISGKNLTIASAFFNTENEADIDATIVKATSGRVFSVSGTAAFTVEIIGLTIRDGSISGLGTGGAGIYQTGSVMIVNNCKFINNYVNGSNGGAIQIWDARATIKNSYFSQNSATSTGGAISASLQNNGRYAIIENCVFENNSAGTSGGAISGNFSTDIEFSVTSCNIQNNSANNGGGIHLSIGNISGTTPEISKTIIANNTANVSGGGVFITGRRSKFTNNTIVKNQLLNHGAANKGAGIYFTGSTNFTYSYLRNNIIKFNAEEETDKEIYLDYSGTNCKVNMYYNCISEEANDYLSANENAEFDFVAGNITADPLFVDFANNDFNLQETSPCIDAGDPDSNENFETWLTDEDDRDADGTRLDIGALYYHQDIDPQIIADFTFFTYGEFAPLSVEFFQNTTWVNTEAPTTWEWDFNNDGTVNSTEQNPIFVYETPGTYTVSLSVGNGNLSNTVIKTEIIVVEDSGYELEELVFDFTQVEFFGNLCDENYTDQNVVFSGASSDPEFTECYIYIGGSVVVNSFSDTFIADFAQLDGEVLEVAIKFWDNCGNNCTGARAYSGADLILSQSNPEMASGDQALSYKFTTEFDSPIDLFHFYGMESGLYKMYVKKIKPVIECNLSAQINITNLSCTNFEINETVESDGNDYSIIWMVNGIEFTAQEMENIELPAGTNTIELIVTYNADEECTVTITEEIFVAELDIDIQYEIDNDNLGLSYDVTITGFDAQSYTITWDFGDETIETMGNLTGTHTYSEVGEYEIQISVYPTYNSDCFYTESIIAQVGEIEPVCEISAQIDVYEISCSEFAISESVFNNDNPFTIQWQVNGIDIDAEDISPLGLEPGEHIITLTATDNENTECTTTVNRSIIVYSPEVTINTQVNGLELEFEVIVEGIDEFNFSWYFGDSGLGSGDDDQLSGTYTYIEEGTYELALTIMPLNNFSCAFNFNQEIIIGASSDCNQGVIQGELNAEMAALVGDIISIELYMDIEIAMILIETTVITEDGEFIFENLDEGTYILRAVINNPEEYPEYVVTYFNSLMEQAFLWQQSSPIVLACDETATIDLSLITLEDLLTGNGSISGYVYYSNDYDKNTANSTNKNALIGYQAAENILVYLIDNEDNSLVSQTRTDENGNYSFNNIPFGTYRVSIDILAYEITSTHIVEISEDMENHTHIDYAIGNFEITQSEIAVLQIEYLGNGSVTIDEISYSSLILIDIDEELELLAIADASNAFVRWTGDISSTDNPLTIYMTTDIHIVAEFESSTNIENTNIIANVYPNPFVNQLHISNYENINSLVIYNQLGVEVIKLDKNNISEIINTSDLAFGIYFVKLVDLNNFVNTFKIVKQ